MKLQILLNALFFKKKKLCKTKQTPRHAQQFMNYPINYNIVYYVSNDKQI